MNDVIEFTLTRGPEGHALNRTATVCLKNTGFQKVTFVILQEAVTLEIVYKDGARDEFSIRNDRMYMDFFYDSVRIRVTPKDEAFQQIMDEIISDDRLKTRGNIFVHVNTFYRTGDLKIFCLFEDTPHPREQTHVHFTF